MYATYDLASRPVLDDRSVPAAADVVAAIERPDLSVIKSVSDCGVTDIAALSQTTDTSTTAVEDDGSIVLVIDE